ncbi:hypothetical protein CRG98_018787 [Punica granatum]|uniref:Secreted protein n=1 Tax=Punica granatum TaxID=22663 RepID=A0A2I0JWV6_PUNGR|nr:hypothetical protein CRG98_018787 [Punica granatum]
MLLWIGLALELRLASLQGNDNRRWFPYGGGHNPMLVGGRLCHWIDCSLLLLEAGLAAKVITCWGCPGLATGTLLAVLLDVGLTARAFAEAVPSCSACGGFSLLRLERLLIRWLERLFIR